MVEIKNRIFKILTQSKFTQEIIRKREILLKYIYTTNSILADGKKI